MQGVVPRFVGTPGEVRHAGRSLGADNRAIYLDRIGLDEVELARLTEAGVI
jgi:crotonobetainyl-CoA:carnitine CoA-transferase CaiB-like acyl-CoA transferase